MLAILIQLLTVTLASLISISLKHLNYAHCCDLFICLPVLHFPAHKTWKILTDYHDIFQS